MQENRQKSRLLCRNQGAVTENVVTNILRDPLFCWEYAFAASTLQSDMLRIYERSFYNSLTESHYPGGICLPGQRKPFVSPEGRFYVCEKVYYINSENDLYCIGNVEKGIEPEKVIKLIDEYLSVIEEDCCKCWATRMCGVCFAPITPDEHQKITAIKKRQQCQRAREEMHDALIKFYSVIEKDPKAFDFMDKMKTE